MEQRLVHQQRRSILLRQRDGEEPRLHREHRDQAGVELRIHLVEPALPLLLLLLSIIAAPAPTTVGPIPPRQRRRRRLVPDVVHELGLVAAGALHEAEAGLDVGRDAALL